ncbi:MAG: RpiB/LacA/LacB family sugar-phosphate isomerase, partial [Halanaerobiaceae bacterium]|nr:RpiB/LacA/LacB family sugar-phosphate isomerase [Halanaerobiaceae bacterium]
MPGVLFVCTGNTCRSPMAEFLFNKYVKEDKKLKNWVAVSAGISTLPGLSASEHVITVLGEEGLDPLGHRSRQLDDKLIQEADLVLTMTEKHKEIIIGLYPEFAEKVFTLKEFTKEGDDDRDRDIPDPFGQSEEIYRKTKEELKNEVKLVLKKLKQFVFQAGKFNKRENNYYRGDMVKIAIGSDHAGYEMKKEIIKYLKDAGYEYKDMGTDGSQSVDYPDYGFKVARAVADGEYDRGILICGTGIGMSITANKVKGIRAALC